MNFSLDELNAAFSEVADKDDWKRPIEAVIPADRLGIVICAITHHTGTVPSVEPSAGAWTTENGKPTGMRYDAFKVTAAGYRAGPCN